MKCTQVNETIVNKSYTYYMFRPIMRPTSARCVRKDGYIVIAQTL